MPARLHASMDNVAQHLQRLQLGPGYQAGARRRWARPAAAASSSISPSSCDPHFHMRRLLTHSFRSSDDTTFLRHDASSNTPTPVFQVAFAPSRAQEHWLAAADEDGVVSLIDTRHLAFNARAAAPRIGIVQSVHEKWQAHENAIFDVAWARDASFLLTAAGDLRVCAWDIETQLARFTIHGGHWKSVKCVRQSIDNKNMIATGARDGHVLVWDARSPEKAVAQLMGVHKTNTTPSAAFVSPNGSARKRRKTGTNTEGSPCSVTSVEFGASGFDIITAGAADGVVKFWDLRRLLTPRKIPLASRSSAVDHSPIPVRTLSCSSRVGSQRGITSLALDASHSRLLVNVLNDDLCLFDISGAREPEPLLRLDGHVTGSFYVKSTFSPDGDFVISGSGDGAVYLWDVSISSGASQRRVRSPVVALKGHTSEVNGVAWHASDFTRLATSSDDGTIRVWTADRSHHVSSESVDENSPGFQLKRKQRAWQNWREFEGQDCGRAYAVNSDDMEVEEEQPESSPPLPPSPSSSPALLSSPAPVSLGGLSLFTPPPSNNRSQAPSTATPSTRPPSARKNATRTLLDFWGR